MGEYHDFAMLVHVTPENRLGEWDRVLRAAKPGPDMSANVRKPTLVMFAVKADFEFLAIEKAETWLKEIASQLHPPIQLEFNAQPSEEV